MKGTNSYTTDVAFGVYFAALVALAVALIALANR